MHWQYGIVYGMLASAWSRQLCARKPMHFSGESHGENIVLHIDTTPSCKGFQSSYCNKRNINEAALFSRLTPDAACATPCDVYISLLSCFLIPSSPPHLSTSLAKHCGCHSTAWLQAWRQILACLYESWDQSGPPPPPHDLHTHSALPCIVVGEVFRSFSENEDGMTQYKKILIGNVTLSLML